MKKGLLNGIPIFLGHQHGIGARTGNQNRLMRFEKGGQAPSET